MKTETEIEVRFKIKNKQKFLATLKHLDSAPVFPSARGDVEEINLVFTSALRPDTTLRLRKRTFSNNTQTFVYTEKGKNTSDVVRQKQETNTPLTSGEFYIKLKELFVHGALRDVYERHFCAEQYRIYQGVEIELFEFPLLGVYSEFELKRGGMKALESVVREFGFRLRDNVHESVHDLAQKACMKRGLLYSPILVFSAEKWRRFCSVHDIPWRAPIDFYEQQLLNPLK